MDTTLTGEEVLRMAMDMEQTGQMFYEALAGGTSDRRAAGLFRRLAREETSHYAQFKQMHDAVAAGQMPVHWSAEQAESLHQTVKRNIQPGPAQVREVAMGGNLTDAVALAREMEQGAIRFYSGLIDVVDAETAEVIRSIVKSEESHLKDLVAFAW